MVDLSSRSGLFLKLKKVGVFPTGVELFQENEKVLFDSEASVNQERRPVYCISVPAVNQWAQVSFSHYI